MAQLTDDCFAFGGELMNVDDAVALIEARVTPLRETETLPVQAALGRVLAADVFAEVAVPFTDNSAVDGYAVRHADLSATGVSALPISQRVQAGSKVLPLSPNTAARIFTGAPMPPGADTVFMQEDASEAGGIVSLPHGLKRGANARHAGEDFQQGVRAIEAGTRLDPRHLAALAAIGHREVTVCRQVRVALFSTGDELVGAGQPLHAGRAYDANMPLISAMLRQRGAHVSECGILRDDAAVTALALKDAAATHDLILTTGGVSTGEADFVKSAVECSGALTFWRLAIKPGRPVAMGTIGGAAFVGLPGNPVAAFVTCARLAVPLIDRLCGARARSFQIVPGIADFSYAKKAGRREYVRASATIVEGRLLLTKYPREGAALLSSLVDTDGLVELEEPMTQIRPGDPVRFLPYGLIF